VVRGAEVDAGGGGGSDIVPVGFDPIGYSGLFDLGLRDGKGKKVDFGAVLRGEGISIGDDVGRLVEGGWLTSTSEESD
jgi:hypothetical protein